MILEEVMYQEMFCMIQGGRLIGYTKHNKEDIGAHKCVVFWYDKF